LDGRSQHRDIFDGKLSGKLADLFGFRQGNDF
jgi:hypothetical protein